MYANPQKNEYDALVARVRGHFGNVDIGGRPQNIWRNQGVTIDTVIRGLRARGIPFATNMDGTR